MKLKSFPQAGALLSAICRFIRKSLIPLPAGCLPAAILFSLGQGLPVSAATNGVAATPAMGWSTWSFLRGSPTEASVEAQALAMHNSGLQNHGFVYINLDDFYYFNPSNTVDAYGRWLVSSNSFPDGMAAVAAYVHSLGLKFGIYVTPGIPVAAYNQNTPIEGTSYHAQDIVTSTSAYEVNYNGNFGGKCMYYIDYTKPGAQAFINSWANLFASWGVDYLKIDGVGDWDISDIQAWSQALVQTGRPIHLELSNSLDVNNGSIWRQYANGWRAEGDIECYCSGTSYPLTDWNNVLGRFNDAPKWTQYGGPGGWNDLDSLEIGNGTNDGLTTIQRQTTMTLWSICCSPLILGTDLTQLDTNDLAMLFNDRVLQVNQAGSIGAPLTYNTTTQVWRAAESDGTYAVAFFNLGATATTISVTWAQLGFTNAAEVQDLWAGTDLGSQASGYSASVPTNGATFYRIAPVFPAFRYLANAPANVLGGGASLVTSTELSGGVKVGNVGNGGTLTFNNVVAPSSGTYNVTFFYENGGASRTANISINGGSATAQTFGTSGSWTTLASKTIAVTLQSGSNSIAISNPTAAAPDFDSVVVQSAVLAASPAPTGLAASGGLAQATLSWLASGGASGYLVKYGTVSGSYTVTNTTATAGLTVAGLNNGVVYYFVVAATNSAGTSTNSSEVSAWIGSPAAPTNLVATAGIALVSLQWNSSYGATSYNLKRSTTDGGTYTVIASQIGTNYTDTSVINGTTYYYVVSALNGSAESTNSSQVSVTPGLANGTYKIISQLSGLALDDPNGGGSGTGTDQQPYSGTNQQWTIVSVGGGNYKITAANGYALSGPTGGAQLVLSSYTGAANQLWIFQVSGSAFTVHNAGTGQVLDDFGASMNAGNVVGQWTVNGGVNQNWLLTLIGAGNPSATAQSIGVNFVNSSIGGIDNTKAGSLLPTEVAGAGIYAQANWNNLSQFGGTNASDVTLTNSAGAATALTIQWNAPLVGSFGTATSLGTPDGKLMDGYLGLVWPNLTILNVSGYTNVLTIPKTNDVPVAYVGGLQSWYLSQGAEGFTVVVYQNGNNWDNDQMWVESVAGSPFNGTMVAGPDLTPHLWIQNQNNPFTGTYTQIPQNATNQANEATVKYNYGVFTSLTNDAILIRTGDTVDNWGSGAMNGFQIVPILPTKPTANLPAISPSSTVFAGVPVTLTETATGDPFHTNLWYQWYGDNATGGPVTNAILDATNATLNVTPTNNATTYRYLVVVTNIFGASTSSVASVIAFPPVNVSVNTSQTMATMPPQGLGVNVGVYDGNLINSNLAPMLKAAGITCVRLPGGSMSDQYNWQNHSGIGGQYVDSNDTFDNVMNTDVIPAGAQALVTVNYGSNPANSAGGDTNLAAAWVAYANGTKNYGIKYWEIGNEVGGNGYYGTNLDWEYDLHYPETNAATRVGQPALSPAAYGTNAIQFISAMKAQDNTIKCGVGFDTGNATYNSQLLGVCGSVADFVIIHWYPGEPTANILAASTTIVPTIKSTMTQLTNSVGATKASQMQILVTETGADQTTGAAVSLFAADNYLTWLENGAVTVNYWYLDDIVLPNQTPAHGYYGAMMAHLLANVGDTFLVSTSALSGLRVHAVARQDGKMGVMLVNMDPTYTIPATVNFSGAALASSGTWYQFGLTNFIGANDYPSYPVSTNTVSGLGNLFTISVPPYTMIDLLIPPAVTNTPPVIAAITNRTVNVGQTVAFTASATDTDQPPQTLTFALPAGATNATLNTNSGAFSFRPLVTQANSTNNFTVQVSDNGTPPLNATQSFSVVVNPLSAPGISNISFAGGQFSFKVSGQSGPDYAIETSTNLTQPWSSLFITNSPAVPFVWTDADTSNSPQRFYRIQLGPPLP